MTHDLFRGPQFSAREQLSHVSPHFVGIPVTHDLFPGFSLASGPARAQGSAQGSLKRLRNWRGALRFRLNHSLPYRSDHAVADLDKYPSIRSAGGVVPFVLDERHGGLHARGGPGLPAGQFDEA